MNIKKAIKSTALAGLVGLAFAGASPVMAIEEADVNVGDEFSTYGYSLDDNQKQNTKALLNAQNVLPENEYIITQERYANIFGGQASNVGNIYSSMHITFEDEKDGIDVNIVTPENILEVSEYAYRNAVITSGLGSVTGGATVDVASTIQVSGEGALSGIYAIYTELGLEVDPELANLTSEELALNSDLEGEVASENEGATSEETDALTNGLLADIKNEISKLAQGNNGGQLGETEVRDVVINIVNNYGLSLSDETIQRLIDFAQSFSQTDIALDPAVQEQLAQLGGKLQEAGGDIWEGIKTTVSDPEFQEATGNLFSQIWNAITTFFSSLFGGEATA